MYFVRYLGKTARAPKINWALNACFYAQSQKYKNIIDTLPVLCVDKNYQGINDIIWTETDLVEKDFTPPYPDANRWSTTHHVEILTVKPNDQLDPNTDHNSQPTGKNDFFFFQNNVKYQFNGDSF